MARGELALAEGRVLQRIMLDASELAMVYRQLGGLELDKEGSFSSDTRSPDVS